MQDLYSPKTYPPTLQAQIKAMPPLATDIANRWLMGWPKRVKGLIVANQYLAALTSQEAQERKAYLSPGNGHLAHHEIAEMYGLTPEPPTIS
jgi:hypothetical protein